MIHQPSELFSPNRIAVGIKPNSKKQLISLLAEKAAEESGLPANKIADVVLEREKLGSTGAGRAIAIPHGRMAGVEKIFACCAILGSAVDFDAVDNLPVDVVIMLLAPENAGAEHLRVLAKVSRLLRDQAICERLRGCTDADAVYAILTNQA